MSPYEVQLISVAADVQALGRQMTHGCGNHGCVIARPTGQATNGPCRCFPRHFVARLLEIAENVEKLSV